MAQSVAQLSCKQQVTSSSLVASSLTMVPGLRAFRYSFNVSAPEGESPYVAVSEAEWDDAQAYGEALSTPEGRKSLADIRKYATGGAVVVDYPPAPSR